MNLIFYVKLTVVKHASEGKHKFLKLPRPIKFETAAWHLRAETTPKRLVVCFSLTIHWADKQFHYPPAYLQRMTSFDTKM